MFSSKQWYSEQSSLRSNRFCGVREQRITAWKMEWVNEGGGGGEGRKETFPSFPSPTPIFLFLALAPFLCAGKTLKILFLGLSLLPNPTVTFATQAMSSADTILRHIHCRSWWQPIGYFKCLTPWNKRLMFHQLKVLMLHSWARHFTLTVPLPTKSVHGN